MIDFTAWTKATGDLNWGAQKVIHDALSLAAEGKVTIVYGADYMDGQPCLINSVGQMLATGGGRGVPTKNFGELVGQFDVINRHLYDEGVNTDFNHMSPLAAEILVQHFAELKPEPEFTIPVATSDAFVASTFDEIIPEASDADLAASWLAAISSDNVPYVNYDEPTLPDPEVTAPSDADIQALLDEHPNWR